MKTFVGQYRYCDFYGGWSEWRIVTVEAETEWQAADKLSDWVREQHGGDFHNDNIHVEIFPRIE